MERRLLAARPDLRIEREILKTPGDRVQDEALFRIGDKGLFTKDVEAALVPGEAETVCAGGFKARRPGFDD